MRRQRRRDPRLMNFGTSICERYDFALIRRSDIPNIDAVITHTQFKTVRNKLCRHSGLIYRSIGFDRTARIGCPSVTNSPCSFEIETLIATPVSAPSTTYRVNCTQKRLCRYYVQHRSFTQEAQYRRIDMRSRRTHRGSRSRGNA